LIQKQGFRDLRGSGDGGIDFSDGGAHVVNSIRLRVIIGAMAIVPAGWVSADEISKRIDTLQMRYAGNPLIERIEHHVASDWTGEPAVFVTVTLSQDRRDGATLKSLANDLRSNLLRFVHTEDIGLHSYLNFVGRS
jgi:hypothetical protein